MLEDVAPTGQETRPVLLRTRGLGKSFGTSVAVKAVDLEVTEGTFVTLLGPSGCGKTTILRMVAGFETISRGSIELDGRDLGALPPERRPVNTVFQSYALFPHMTVHDNVAFSLSIRRQPKSDIERRVRQALEAVEMGGFAKRYPGELSGGQQQRVAIARAIISEPRLLLLDEPLSALDRKMREHMQVELKDLQRRLGITFIYVTHDQEEAFALSDLIVVMSNGEIVQQGRPDVIYSRPANGFVADFIGGAAIIHGTVTTVAEGRATLDGPLGAIDAPCAADLKPAVAAILTLRLDSVVIGEEAASAAERRKGVVRHCIYQGGRSLVEIDVGGVTLRGWSDRPVPVGGETTVGILTERAWITHG